MPVHLRGRAVRPSRSVCQEPWNQHPESVRPQLFPRTPGRRDSPLAPVDLPPPVWTRRWRPRRKRSTVCRIGLLRLQAEFENYKKRMAREKAEFLKFANEGLLLEFLPVLDNLERALASARAEADADSRWWRGSR